MAEQLEPPQNKTVHMTGYLQKRQRGKYIKRETQRKKLKFQDRFCELNEDELIYRKKENSMIRGSFLVERMTIVNNTDPKAFPKGTLRNPELCFQVGNESEVLYLVAANEDSKKEWMGAFKNATQNKGNVMLKFYHCGVYGTNLTEKWSCCDKNGYLAPGCTDANKTIPHSLTRFNSVTSVDTLFSDTATGSYSSSCDSYSFSERLNEWREPVVFGDSSSAILLSSRADTGESGIDENQFDRVYSKQRRKLLFMGDSSDNDIDYVALRYSSEVSINKDEGIEVDVKRGNIKQEEAVCILCAQTTVKEESDHGDTSVTHKGVLPSKHSLYLIDSHKLPHPPTALLLHQHSLISGNGMLQIWDTTPDLTLDLSLKLAGHAFSFDIWRDYVAVGSSVVQLIQLNQTSEPKRILYTKAKGSLQYAQEPSFLVTFIGDEGRLATAKVGESTIDIWAPPSSHSQVVLSPKCSFSTDTAKVISLAASKDPKHPWVVAVTELNGLMKLYTMNWKASSFQASIVRNEHDLKRECQDTPYLSHVDELYFVLGNGRTLSLLDGQTGHFLHSIMIDEAISTLSHIKGKIAIGTTNGEVKIFTDNNLTEIYRLNDEQISAKVMAIALATDCSRLYAAHNNGVVNVWNDRPMLDSGSHNFQECVVGMQLCSEGILSRRKVFHIGGQEALTISCEEEDIHLQLPPEILKCTNPSLEVAFAPFGPVGAHFIFPDGMIPVSPAMWLCFSPQTEFQDPAILKVPHCFECIDREDLRCLYFLKAEHEDITRDETGQSVITFKKMDRRQFELDDQDSQYCILREHHFCIYCMAVENTSIERNVVGQVNYCLSILKPKHYPTNKNLRIYCIIHFNLKTCKELVQKQTPDDYEVYEKLLQFQTGRYESALEIHVNKTEAKTFGWVITMESEKQIYAEDVNFFNYRNPERLFTACTTADIHKPYPYAYPPRFVLEVSSRYAMRYSTIELTFSGARREISHEIQLHPIRTESDLNRVGYDESFHRPADGPISLNGMWPSGDSAAM